jgi:GGDEF domain-containing protein
MMDLVTKWDISDGVVTPGGVRQQYANLFDHATSLPGWPLLIDRTRMALARAARDDVLVAVVVIDDVRRRSPDSPDLLDCVAALRESVLADDTVARVSGRTFVFVLNDVVQEDEEKIAASAHELVENLDISCNIGIALGSPPSDAEALINQARQSALPLPPPVVSGWEDQYLG